MNRESGTSGIYPIPGHKGEGDAIHRLEALNPALITAYYFFPLDKWKRNMALQSRIVADYELEYILSSDGGAQTIEGVTYQLKKGDIVFRRPGETTQGFMRYECICIIFSLHGTLPESEEYRINYKKPVQQAFKNPAIRDLRAVIGTSGDETFHTLFDRLIRIFVNPVPYAKILEKAMLLELLYRCLRQESAEGKAMAGERALSPEGAGGAATREKIENSRIWIWKNYTRRITVADIACQVRLSEAYYHKCFAKIFGITPAEYLSSIRIERARELLATTDMPVHAVAQECGFSNERYFYRFFGKRTGMTPKAFRDSHGMPFI